MQINDFLSVEYVSADLKGETKFQIIEELLDLLSTNEKIVDREIALQDVLAREGYLSTGLEKGLAVPHAKTDGVSGLVIAFGLKREGVDFESLDGKPAKLIFLVLSPRDTSGPHIQALAIISRNLKEHAKREELLKANSSQEIMDIIKNDFTSQ
jgi:mannitol/fructose-specific phosphotransferase system IIA component (Ntr-type)